MAFGNIAGRAAYILDLDKSALDTGLPNAERQVKTSSDRMAKSFDQVGTSATGAGTALGGGAGLAGRMGLVGIAAATGVQALQHLSAGLRVTGAEAGTTEGRFRNLGAELAQGDIVGGIVALGKQTTATTKQLTEMADVATESSGRLRLIEASAAAASIGLKDMASQIDAVVAAATRIDTTTFKFDVNAQFGANPAAISGQQTFGLSPLAGARAVGADLRNKSAAEQRAALDRAAPSSIANQINRAALTPGLDDDLKAASVQEAYFRNRVRGVKTESERYGVILGSLKTAHAQRQGVVDQITAANKSVAATAATKAKIAAADRKAAADAAARAAEAERAEDARRLRAGLTLRETKLRNNLAAAELTKKTLEDDKLALRRLIAFDREQERNKRLTLMEREGFRTKKLKDREALAGLTGGKSSVKGGSEFDLQAQQFLRSLTGQAKQFASNVTVVQNFNANTPPFAAARDHRRAAEAAYG